MIPLSDVSWQTQSWQNLLSQGIKTVTELGQALNLPLAEVDTGFPLLVPAPYLSRIVPGDPDDPLLLQILPVASENLRLPGYITDPLDEHNFLKPPGLIQKYAGRVLVIVTGQCGIHCRYCFRRHFPYNDVKPNLQQWTDILDAIGKDETLGEVILSGGDPLVVKDSFIDRLIHQLADIPHLHTLRIHSRLPVVIPQRITASLTEALASTRLKVVLVNHINHANEIDDQVAGAMNQLRLAGVHLLNQTVLLKGINDSADRLEDLSQALWSAAILPYYLHMLDPVEGAAHFDMTEQQAQGLMKQLLARLPGYLVPRLVREIPDQPSKTPLHPMM